MLRSKIFFSSVEHHWPLARRAESWLSCLDLPAATTSYLVCPNVSRHPAGRDGPGGTTGCARWNIKALETDKNEKRWITSLFLLLRGPLPRCCQLGDFSRMQESLKPPEVPVQALYKAGVPDGWENPQLTLNLVPKNGRSTDLSTAPELRRAQESEGPPLRWGLPRTVCTGEFPPELQKYVAQHSDLDALGIWPSRDQNDLHSWSFLRMQNQIIQIGESKYFQNCFQFLLGWVWVKGPKSPLRMVWSYDHLISYLGTAQIHWFR